MMCYSKKTFLLGAFIVGFVLMLPGPLVSQTFTTLHNFAGSPNDGANQIAGVILSGNMLYGTSDTGGSIGQGAVYAVATDGTGFAILHSFAGGSDGSFPSYGSLI